MQPPYQWVRCTQGEARYDFDSGYSIYRIINGTARRIGTVINQQALENARGDPFHDHFLQIEQEERDHVGRYESVAYEQDIIGVRLSSCLEGPSLTITDLDEEYEDQDPTPFNKAMSPSRGGKSTLNSNHAPNQTDINFTGSGTFHGHRSTSSTGVHLHLTSAAPALSHRLSAIIVRVTRLRHLSSWAPLRLMVMHPPHCLATVD
jgi:hypothetical protein